MSFKITNREAGDSSFVNHSQILQNWEKCRADGKWFWLFKRAAAWLSAVIVLFGAGNFLLPDQISFRGTQIFIAVLMFAGYLIGSWHEWAKMEKMFGTQTLPSE